MRGNYKRNAVDAETWLRHGMYYWKLLHLDLGMDVHP